MFYSLLIVLAKEYKTQVTQFHSSCGLTESSVIDQKDLYNSDVNGKGNTTGHILSIKSLVAWSKLSHHLKDMLSPGVSQGHQECVTRKHRTVKSHVPQQCK